MAIRKAWFLPTVVAAGTDLGTAIFVHQHEPTYPLQFLTFQIMMLGAATLIAAPQRWLWSVSLLLR
jgi:hypothetical protein